MDKDKDNVENSEVATASGAKSSGPQEGGPTAKDVGREAPKEVSGAESSGTHEGGPAATGAGGPNLEGAVAEVVAPVHRIEPEPSVQLVEHAKAALGGSRPELYALLQGLMAEVRTYCEGQGKVLIYLFNEYLAYSYQVAVSQSARSRALALFSAVSRI